MFRAVHISGRLVLCGPTNSFIYGYRFLQLAAGCVSLICAEQMLRFQQAEGRLVTDPFECDIWILEFDFGAQSSEMHSCFHTS